MGTWGTHYIILSTLVYFENFHNESFSNNKDDMSDLFSQEIA